MKPIQRFFESLQVDKETDCWVWQRSRDKGGYAKFYDGKAWVASRWAYEFFVRPIAAGYLICHRCDNPPCVNPRHLFQGTTNDNFMDALKKKRVRAKLTADQVREIRKALVQGTRGATLAKKYGVRKAAIYEIKHRFSYKWVEETS